MGSAVFHPIAKMLYHYKLKIVTQLLFLVSTKSLYYPEDLELIIISIVVFIRTEWKHCKFMYLE